MSELTVQVYSSVVESNAPGSGLQSKGLNMIPPTKYEVVSLNPAPTSNISFEFLNKLEI